MLPLCIVLQRGDCFPAYPALYVCYGNEVVGTSTCFQFYDPHSLRSRMRTVCWGRGECCSGPKGCHQSWAGGAHWLQQGALVCPEQIRFWNQSLHWGGTTEPLKRLPGSYLLASCEWRCMAVLMVLLSAKRCTGQATNTKELAWMQENIRFNHAKSTSAPKGVYSPSLPQVCSRGQDTPLPWAGGWTTWPSESLPSLFYDFLWVQAVWCLTSMGRTTDRVVQPEYEWQNPAVRKCWDAGSVEEDGMFC